MLIINLWGAPGSGKSTTAAGLFFLMKINKWKVELVTEFAKELVWDQRHSFFGDQVGIFAEQNHRLLRLADHNIECAITDSPLPLPAFYKDPGYLAMFDGLVFEQFHRYNNLNYLLRRKHSFEAIGRRHDEQQAEQIEKRLEEFMVHNAIDYIPFDANPLTPQTIFDDVMARMPRTIPMPLIPSEPTE
jgi:hypothetical protein